MKFLRFCPFLSKDKIVTKFSCCFYRWRFYFCFTISFILVAFYPLMMKHFLYLFWYLSKNTYFAISNGQYMGISMIACYFYFFPQLLRNFLLNFNLFFFIYKTLVLNLADITLMMFLNDLAKINFLSLVLVSLCKFVFDWLVILTI